MADDSPLACFQVALKEYLNSPNFSDVTIRCEGEDFKAHRLVLCAQSKWFFKACNGDWKEATERVIDLPDDKLPVVEAMLDFFYRFDYQATSSPMIFNAKVYSIADKYDIPTLKSHALGKFRKSVETCWGMDDFPLAIREVYSSTLDNDRGLRDLVVKAACEHADALSKEPEFRTALEEASSFAADVVLSMAKGRPKQTTPRTNTYDCPNCGNSWQAILPSGISCYCPNCGNSRSNWDSYITARA
ncbi:POZ domain-containing protein [Glonium stellatum]|uniref:POZ domain-containing protein n=1 Tax=Glonium stellatum TaxID=574774 RepID=A0A8E2JU53_9PEZI|nr:POZ domain-containing protein [Glonium stellatum]